MTHSDPHDDEKADLLTLSRTIGERIIFVELMVYPCGCSKLLQVAAAPSVDPDEETELANDEILHDAGINTFTREAIFLARGVWSARIQAAMFPLPPPTMHRRKNLRGLDS